MKKFVTLVVLVAFVGSFAGLALAADKPAAGDKPKVATVAGTIAKIEEKTVTVKVPALAGGDAKEVKFTVADRTAVTVDGKEAKLADLKADMAVVVTPARKEGVAAKIEATTAVAAPGAAVPK